MASFAFGYPQMGGFQGFGMPFMGGPFGGYGNPFMGGQFGNPYMQPYGGFGNPYQQMYGNPYQQFGNPYGGYGQMYQNPYQQFYSPQPGLLGGNRFNPYSQPGVAANLEDISFAHQVAQPIAEPAVIEPGAPSQMPRFTEFDINTPLGPAISRDEFIRNLNFGNRTRPQPSTSEPQSFMPSAFRGILGNLRFR